jgi:hypothetical protein
MNRRFLTAAFCGFAVVAGVLISGKSEEKSHKLTTVSIRKMADSLHAVITADRQVYSEIVVQRLHTEEGRVTAAENWREAHCLPVHAQMLRLAGQNIQRGGAEFSYTLRSLWPINENYGPQTEAEKAGLEFVTGRPGEDYYTEEVLGGRSYFTAVYADRATLPSCVECHNKHPRSPRHDYKVNDVMGAIVVRVPLEF